jgi:hypothetical protein
VWCLDYHRGGGLEERGATQCLTSVSDGHWVDIVIYIDVPGPPRCLMLQEGPMAHKRALYMTWSLIYIDKCSDLYSLWKGTEKTCPVPTSGVTLLSHIISTPGPATTTHAQPLLTQSYIIYLYKTQVGMAQ